VANRPIKANIRLSFGMISSTRPELPEMGGYPAPQ
jgi:hypothetical protein